MTVKFNWERYTKNYSVYAQENGINKLYLPLEVTNSVIYAELTPNAPKEKAS